MTVGVSVNVRGLEQVLNEATSQEALNRAGCAMAQEVLRLSDPYVPTLSGSMYRSAQTDQTAIRKGIVHWNTNYAEYAWNPTTKSGRPKHYTTNGNPSHPLAQGEWALKVLREHEDSIKEVAKRQILRELNR